jgi:hypothetical protein
MEIALSMRSVPAHEQLSYVLAAVTDDFLYDVNNGGQENCAPATVLLVIAHGEGYFDGKFGVSDTAEMSGYINRLSMLLVSEELRRGGVAQYERPVSLFDNSAPFDPRISVLTNPEVIPNLSMRASRVLSMAQGKA